jgi:hypothetical protein
LPKIPENFAVSGVEQKTLPYNPIQTVMRSSEHARRTIRGILESYNSNYDALAEAVQNSMDALEDAVIRKLPGPYLIEITIDLKNNQIAVFDTENRDDSSASMRVIRTE